MDSFKKEEVKIEIIEIRKESDFYPDKLKIIKNPPEKIYAIGNIELLNTYSISIIGSRACSIEGINTAKQFARELSNKGITITSGMALRNRFCSTYWSIGSFRKNNSCFREWIK